MIALPLQTFRDRNGRIAVDSLQFEQAQKELMARGSPDDPCGHCGCRRKYHRPTKTFSYAKSGGSSGKSVELNVLAPTCCECKYCFDDCVAFVEPYKGQRSLRCTFEPKTA